MLITIQNVLYNEHFYIVFDILTFRPERFVGVLWDVLESAPPLEAGQQASGDGREEHDSHE